jgi:hypothetical protein
MTRADIDAAKQRMSVKFGGGREIKRLETHLLDGETVEAMTTGAYGKGTGLLVMTNQRLLFVQDGMMSKTTEDFPYSQIASVSWKSGVALGTLTVFAGGTHAEIKNMNKNDGKAISDALRTRVGQPTSGVPAAAIDLADQLGRLAALRDQGVLTEEEFAAQKAKLLS